MPLPASRRALDVLDAAASRLGLARSAFDPPAAAAELAGIAARASDFARAEGLLADADSRELLLTVLSLRALGPRHVDLPVSERRFRAGCARVDRELRVEEDVRRDESGAALHRYRVPAQSGPISIVGRAFLIQEFFECEQYALRSRRHERARRAGRRRRGRGRRLGRDGALLRGRRGSRGTRALLRVRARTTCGSSSTTSTQTPPSARG